MKLKAIIFWLLMLGSVVGLWWTRTDSRDFLRTAAIVIPFVLLTSWFSGRFSGARKRMAEAAIFSVCGVVLTAAIATWKFMLVSVEYGSQRNLLEGVIASIVFAVCCSVLAWSVFRLRKLPS